MENMTSPVTPAAGSKTGMIGIAIAMLIVGGIAGYAFGNGGASSVESPTATPTVLTSVSPLSSTGSNLQTCSNQKYGFSLMYPLDWEVWTRGNGEARSATCNEILGQYLFAQDLFRTPFENQINLGVFTRDNQVPEFWQGINSLDDYVKRLSPAWKVQKETTTIDGERLVWLRREELEQVVAYHNSAIYEFIVYSVDDANLQIFFSTFKFTN